MRSPLLRRARRGSFAALCAALGLLALGGAPAGAQTAVPGCAGTAPGGDWPAYGHDLANTRSQPAESAIGPSQAATLAPAWSVAVAAGQTSGAPLNGTPIVVDGCVYAGGADGYVVAANADSGAVVWKSPQLIDPAAAGLGGAIVGSVAVAGGKVLVPVSLSGGPFLAALDQRTGQVLWRSAPVSTYSGSYTNASAQVYGGTVILGFSPPEGDPQGQGGFALIDASSGRILGVTDTVPPADQAKGFAGGGIWSTPAVDTATGFGYVGAGNPSSKQKQDPNTDAILKFDLNRGPGFGAIVAAYAGQVDQYEAPQLAQTPACAASEGTPADTFPLDDPACGQLDLDFGASPSLFGDGHGAELVGDLQKSGYFHVARADTMAPAWKAPIGAPCAFCNADSQAVAGGAVFAVGTPGGQLASLAAPDGSLNWVSPTADGAHYGAVSEAGGVVYTLDSTGFLDGFDATTGAPVLHRPLDADAGQVAGGLTSAGVAIARHTVYAEAGGDVVAYRPAAALP
jgi:outer membrane protein assembly factor BamB